MTFAGHCAGRLLGLAGLAVAAPAAEAQQTAPAPAPSPTRAPIITLPANADQFDLRRVGRPQVQPTPAPSSMPVPAVTPPPIAHATPAPAATPRPSRTSRAEPRAASPSPAPSAEAPPAAAAPKPTESPASPKPEESPAISPVASPVTPVPVATATPSYTKPAWPIWPFALFGAALLAALGWFLLRRRRRRPVEAEAEPLPLSRPAPPPRPVAAPRSVPPPPAPPLPSPVPGPEPLRFELRPLAAMLVEQGLLLDLELIVTNTGATAADAVRVSIATLSANPEQDALIEAFHASIPPDPVAPPFDLAPGAGGRLTARMGLDRARFSVMHVGTRPMIVPLVLVTARWRGGLSVKRHGADFILGGAGQGAKLGPIWLDRADQPVGRIAAQRYFRKAAAAAAE